MYKVQYELGSICLTPDTPAQYEPVKKSVVRCAILCFIIMLITNRYPRYHQKSVGEIRQEPKSLLVAYA